MNDLVHRWHTDSGRDLAGAVIRAMQDRRDLAEVSISRRDGLFDLRGLVLTGHDSRNTWQLQNVVLRRVDASESTLTALRLIGSTVDECRFDAATLDDLRVWGTQFINCSFVGTN